MAGKSFADALREAREAAGLTQTALARRAGLTGSYLSLLESRRRPPPRPRVVRTLCRVLEIDEEPLQEAAALERSPPTVRRRLERMRRERGRVERSRDRLLATTLFHVASQPRVVDPMAAFMELPEGQQAVLGRLLGRIRRVRDLKEAETKSDDLLAGTSTRDRNALLRVLPRVLGRGGRPSRRGRRGTAATRRVPVHDDLTRSAAPLRHLTIDAGLAGGDAFLWRVSVDDAYPRVEQGDLLLLDPGREPAEGDLVAFRHEDRDRLAVLQRLGPPVRLGSPRPEIVPLRLSRDAFRPVGVGTWLLRALG